MARVRHTHKREFFAHHLLLRVATKSLEDAAGCRVGRFNNCLVAMVFSAFAVEALANAVGSRVVSDWPSFERLRPLEKIDELVHALNIQRDARKPPWPTLRFLASFRNDIAHPKPEQLVKIRMLPSHTLDGTLLDGPQSKLEREITIGNARKILEAVQNLKGLLTDALPVAKRFGIYVDSTSGSATLADDA